MLSCKCCQLELGRWLAFGGATRRTHAMLRQSNSATTSHSKLKRSSVMLDGNLVRDYRRAVERLERPAASTKGSPFALKMETSIHDLLRAATEPDQPVTVLHDHTETRTRNKMIYELVPSPRDLSPALEHFAMDYTTLDENERPTKRTLLEFF